MPQKPSNPSKPGKSLTDLPPEVRTTIYEYVVWREFDVRLQLASPNSVTRVRSKGKPGLRLGLDTISPAAPCGDCVDIAQTTCAFMQTCKKIHDEVAPYLYGMASFIFAELAAFTVFLSNIPDDCKPLIKEISLAHRHNRDIDEKAEKEQLKALAESLTGLCNLHWQGLDRTADPTEKGTEWKPHELRKIITVLENSPTLYKVFYDFRGCTCCTLARFTDASGVERDHEHELNVSHEYEAWLEMNRANKCTRRCWGF